MGDWLEMYVKVMELTYWGGTECRLGQLRRGGKALDRRAAARRQAGDAAPDATGLRHRRLRSAEDASSCPAPTSFTGEILHSSQYSDGSNYKGKKVVVIGAASSAHDVAVDLWEAGADVTMVQRSPTTVVRSETLMELAFDIYSEEAVAERHRRRQGRHDRGRDALRAAAAEAEGALRPHPRARRGVLPQARGHRLPARFRSGRDRPDDEGLPHRLGLLCRCRRLAADHRRRDQDQVGRRDRDADADRHPLRRRQRDRGRRDHPVAPASSRCTRWWRRSSRARSADAIGTCWGLGSGTRHDPGPWHGELRNMYKPVAQENLWFQGGNLALSRFFSKFVALQIKARMEEVGTLVYRTSL